MGSRVTNLVIPRAHFFPLPSEIIAKMLGVSKLLLLERFILHITSRQFAEVSAESQASDMRTQAVLRKLQWLQMFRVQIRSFVFENFGFAEA